MVMTHGWPGSFLEFEQVLGPLTDPAAHGADAADGVFDVVVPSLPGYGFSGKPATPGWDIHRIARAWAELMTRLGYERFLAVGSDWGSVRGTVADATDAHSIAAKPVSPEAERSAVAE